MASRLKTVTKLGLLLGAPIGVVLGLFGTGVYLGVHNAHTVTSFEKDWLKLDVEVAPEPPAKPSAGESEASTTEPIESAPVAEPPKPADVAPLKPGPGPVPTAQLPPPEAAPPAAALPQPAAAPAVGPPLSGDLAKRLELPVRVGLKVLVDPELIAAQPEWIDYVQRTVDQASQIYQAQFGIELRLVSVGRWMVASGGMKPDELARDLGARPREGADVLVAFTHRALEPVRDRAQPGEAFNGAHALVHASPDLPDPHLRGLLRELGHVFGAASIDDPEHPDYRAGSWMSSAPIAPGQAPWIDTANRVRILERKDKPFAPEGAVPVASKSRTDKGADDGSRSP